MKTQILLLFLVSSFVVHPSSFSQGPLSPSGPPGPTMKTLDQVEARIPIDAVHTPGDASNQFIIPVTASGSYYLTGNIKVSKNGIRVFASGVTIDLNGFRLEGPGGAFSAGIAIEESASACVIKNGSIRSFGYGLQAVPNSNNNFAQAPTGHIQNVVITDCAEAGIGGGPGWLIENCSANANGYGIFSEKGSRIINCTANGSKKSYGITGVDSVILGCTATLNAGSGIAAVTNGTITNCASTFNQNGISGGASATISGSTASSNRQDGIVADSNCAVFNNDCSLNGTGSGVTNGAGIHVTGNANRIHANNTVANDQGILVEGAGNLIDANHVRNNTGPGIRVPTANARNVITRNVAGNNVNSYTGIASGNQVAPIDTNFTATSPFANFQN